MKAIRSIYSAILIGMVSLSAVGAPASSTPPPECSKSAWQITGAVPSAFYAEIGMQSVGPIQATGCAGVYAGNEGPTLNPSPNLGYLNDGLLNGQDGLLSPTQFISESQLLDLKTPGSKVDPGWVMLGSLSGDAGELTYSSVTPVGGVPFSISQVLKYTQTESANGGDGTWLLEVDKDIVSKLNAANLFKRSYFDHLAFSIKAGDFWAVYDFDFNLLQGFELQTPYSFAGTWTTECDFGCSNGNGKDISHMSVWARDPINQTNEVPVPGTAFLVGVGLIALMYSIRRAGGTA